MMGRFKKSIKQPRSIKKERRQNRTASWISQKLKTRLARWKMATVSCLERMDARLSNQQRKWAFYIGLMCWSSLLFYLLGTAIRRPPASFILPFAADSSEASLRGLEKIGSEDRNKYSPQKELPETVSGTDYSPFKLNRHGTNDSH